MEVKVIVTHEIGSATLSALVSAITGNTAKTQTQKAAPMSVVSEDAADEPAKAAAKPGPKPAPAKAAPGPKTASAAAAKPGPKPKPVVAMDAFNELGEEDQLEAIKAEVTKHSKKGKTEDIKTMLTHFGAKRASELEPGHYAGMYNAIISYGGNGNDVSAAIAAAGEAEGGEGEDDLL